jgi:hypothetical protein
MLKICWMTSKEAHFLDPSPNEVPGKTDQLQQKEACQITKAYIMLQ